MKHTEHMYTGFLNIYKEAGFTSHDVVAKLRGILRQKKIGHLGTLDPNAEGCLPVALGRATKAISLLEDHTKAYDAVLLLGKETDTYDIWGETTAEHEVNVSEEEVAEILLSFVGPQQQVPPMYSARKQNGKHLYELAREGKIVERPSVPVYIDSITIKRIDLPRVSFHVECSKGTYIRSLCHDVGEKLACGGCMESLLRTRAGSFYLEQAHRLSDIERWMRDRRDSVFALAEEGMENASQKKEGSLPELIPIEAAFANLPGVICSSQAETRAINGAILEPVDITRILPPDDYLTEHSINETNSYYIEEMGVFESVEGEEDRRFLLNDKSVNRAYCIDYFLNSWEREFAGTKSERAGEKSAMVRVYLDSNKFLGIYKWSGKKFRPRKVFIQ